MLRREEPEVAPAPGVCHFSRAISKELGDGLRALARQEKATPYVVLLAAFSILLQAKTHRDAFVIGSYVSDRKRVAARSLIGMFAAMVTMKVELEGAPTFREWVAHLREQNDQVTRHQELPFEDLVEVLRAEQMPIPEVQVIFQHFSDPVSSFSLPGMETFRWREVSEETMPWGFQFRVVEIDGDLSMTARFDGKLYEPEGVPPLLADYEVLLMAIVAGPDRTVRDLAGELGLW